MNLYGTNKTFLEMWGKVRKKKKFTSLLKREYDAIFRGDRSLWIARADTIEKKKDEVVLK